jgi:hypothetical protein
MRTSFELKLVASTLAEAQELATKEIAKFLGVESSDVAEKVSIELKVSYPKAETIDEIEQTIASEIFQITVFGSVKQSTVKPFGL